MIKQMASASPRLRARIAGVLYLIIFIAAPSGAKEVTVAKMAITTACDTGVALLFYGLLRPVDKNLALLAAVFRLMLVAFMTVYSFPIFWFLGSLAKDR